jgi:probable HAF family extracellular repeat protein
MLGLARVPGAVVVGLAVGLWWPASAGAAASVYEGSVTVGGTAASFPFTATGSGVLRVRLVWASPSASARLVLQRSTSSGGWLTVASASGAKPLVLRYGAVVAGQWRLRVVPLIGTSTFTLEASFPGSGGVAPPFMTLLFSRTAMHGASSCTLDDSAVVPLSTVASVLASRGLLPSGTVQTETTPDAAEWCGHYGKTLFASWSDIATLRDGYGWAFVSHARHRSDHLPDMSPEEQWNEICGSQVDLIAHGHARGDGLFAYPNNSFTSALQADYAGRCYAFGRTYGGVLTTRVSGLTAPYWQNTGQVIGGRCNDSTMSCSQIAIGVKYTLPSTMISRLATLGSDQWYTLQSYLLVTGSRPGEWNCNGSVSTHWSLDAERYCWSDYLQIISAIPAKVIVSDPRTVADAWGRTPSGRPLAGAAASASPMAPTVGENVPASVLAAAAQLPATYQLTTLPSPAGAKWATAEAIDDNGQVTGGAKLSGALHALAWRNGVLVDLTPGLPAAYAYAAATGKSVAGYQAAGLLTRPTVWSDTTPTTLALPSGFESGHATDVNAAGVVVGDAATRAGYRAVAWRNATPEVLTGLGGRNAFAQDINLSDLITGAAQTTAGQLHATAWPSATTPIDLGTLGGPSSIAAGVNDTGTVIGQADTGSQTSHAAEWQPTSTTPYAPPQDLGTLYPDTDSEALGINASGIIVGDSQRPFLGTDFTVGDSPSEAVAWDSSGIHRLAQLVPDLPTGWNIIRADAINTSGAIAVTLQPPTGGTVAGLLQPTP